MPERLQKFLAGLGLGSRRQIEGWIRERRITVDGEVAELGMQVDGAEKIAVDGRPVKVAQAAAKTRAIMYHKPAGELCTRSDPQGRRTVFQSLPRLRGARWVSVGRLDYQTSGLLLLTTDGELANRLMHPSAGLKREYAVRFLGELSDADIQRLLTGVTLEDGPARCDSLAMTSEEGANKSCLVTVSEGRNRIVRRLFEAVGCRVNRLMRLRYGPVTLPRDLRPGKFRDLSAAEVAALDIAVKKQT